MSQSLKFDAKTISILKNYSQINPSIYFREGSMIATVSPSKTVLSFAKVAETFESDFAIYDLSKFLSIISIFKNPDIIVEDKFLTIKEGARSVNYTFCDPSNIRVPPASNSINMGEPVVDFELTDEQLVGILKATSILRSTEIAIIGDGDEILIQGINSANPSDNSYSVVVGKTDSEFKVIVKVENIKLMNDNYNVSIHKTGKGATIVKFYNDVISYYNAAETTSVI